MEEAKWEREEKFDKKNRRQGMYGKDSMKKFKDSDRL